MLTRVLTAVVGIPILFISVWVGGFLLTGLLVVAGALAAREFSQMTSGWGLKPRVFLSVVLTATFVASAQLLAGRELSAISVLAAAAAAPVAAVAILVASRHSGAIASGVTTASIAILVGSALFLADMIRNQPDGREWILFLLLITFATDTGAFFVGRSIGSRQLAPTISPRKTWEGSFGGLISAVAAGAAFGWIFGFEPNVASVMVAASVLGVAGQFGDLYISKLKRMANLDDSGTMIPGHGGMLDRLDSIMFNVIVLTYTQVPLALSLFDV